jgi:hypothetical protein
VVAARRLQWDALFWQSPIIGLTGEAFLFSIALAAPTSQASRIIASVLALVIAVASVHALAGQRLSELTDSDWLVDYERRHGLGAAHGLVWRNRREELIDEQLKSKDITDRAVAWTRKLLRSLTMWFWTMVGIAFAALAVLGISIIHPALFTH